MSFASVSRAPLLVLLLMAFTVPDDTTPDVEIKLTNGSTLQAKLIKFQGGVYTVLSGKITQEIPAKDVLTIKHQRDPDPSEKNDAEEASQGYLVTISSDPSARIGVVSWKKTCDQLLKRAEAFGIEKSMITREASSMEIRLDKVEEKFALNVIRLFTFKGEFFAYVGTSLTEMEKEKYKAPDAPKGKRWLMRFKGDDSVARPITPLPTLAKPDAFSDSVVVIDKPLPLRNGIDSIGSSGQGTASINGLSITFNMEGMKAFRSLRGTVPNTTIYICLDDQYLTTQALNSGQMTLPVDKTQATVIDMSFKYPVVDKITVTLAPLRSASDKFPAAKQK